MIIPFEKYHGTGNDFILVNNWERQFQFDRFQVERICERRFGIGSDGLILIQSHDAHDFEMVFYNPDGSQSFCGNGSRCAVDFAHKLGIVDQHAQFMAIDGVHWANWTNETVRISINPVDELIKVDHDFFVQTGSPHYVQFVEDINHFPVEERGLGLFNHPIAGNAGTNVNFVELIDEQTIYVRTFERGVFGETYSCGSGVTAAALVATELSLTSPVNVKTKGGCLSVEYQFHPKSTTKYTNIFLTGPVQYVYSGEYSLID